MQGWPQISTVNQAWVSDSCRQHGSCQADQPHCTRPVSTCIHTQQTSRPTVLSRQALPQVAAFTAFQPAANAPGLHPQPDNSLTAMLQRLCRQRMQLTSSIQPQGPSHSLANAALGPFSCDLGCSDELLTLLLCECLGPFRWVPGHVAGCWDAGPDAVTHHRPILHRHGGLVSAVGDSRTARHFLCTGAGSWWLLALGWQQVLPAAASVREAEVQAAWACLREPWVA